MSNGRCRLHGGAALGGASSPRFRHGRYSSYLPQHLLDDFMEALADPDYLNNREAIAASKTRELELLRRISQGHDTNGSQLSRLREVLERAIASRSVHDLVAAVDALESRLPGLDDADALWRELRVQQEHTRKLKETENRLKESLGQRLDKDRAMALMMWFVHIIKEKVGDPHVVRQIAEEVRARLRGPGPRILALPRGLGDEDGISTC